MGAFDDLVPQGSSGGTGAFDDLVPQATGIRKLAQDTGIIPKNRGILEEAARQLGLTARYGLEALGGSGPMFGLPYPETETERMVGGAARGVAGAAGVTKLGQAMTQAASPVVQSIGAALQKTPVANLALGGVSGASSQAAAEGGAGPIGQVAAGVAAPLAAGMVGAATRPLVRTIRDIFDNALMPGGATRSAGRTAVTVSGPQSAQVAQELKTGAQPLSAGQAAIGAGRSEFQGLERAIGKTKDPTAFGRKEGSIAKGIDDFVEQEKKSLNRRLFPAADKILGDIESRGGLNATGVIQKLDSYLTDKTQSMNDSTRGVVTHVLNKLKIASDNGLLDETTGTMNPRTLYEIRKKLGEEWVSLARANGWSKSQAKKAVMDIQSSIDDAIIQAGGKKWRTDYMEPFARGSKALEQVREAPKIAARMGEEGVTAARALAHLDAPEISFSNFLSRPIMIANAVLRKTQGMGSEKTKAELARLMRPENKQEMAKLIDDELRRQSKRLSRADELQRAAALAASVPALSAPSAFADQ